MNYLLIDTSGAHLSVVAKIGEKTEYVFEADCGVNHSARVMPAVEKVLSAVGGGVKDVDFIGAVRGAGSFTGIRIGIATAKGLSVAAKKPTLGITSFDTIAYNINDGKVLAVIDAGHNGYYVAGYSDKRITVLPRYITAEELKKIKKGYKLYSYGKVSGFKTTVVSPLRGLISYAQENGDKATFSPLKTTYCRKSQAEEGR